MNRKRVALLVRTTNEWSRQILMGVAQFAKERNGWNFTRPDADDNGEVFLPDGWQGDGIICRLSSVDVLSQVLKANVSAVNLSWLPRTHPTIANVLSDQVACGELATDYFLKRQFRSFGYIGVPPWHGYSNAIVDSIAERLQPLNLQLDVFAFPSHERYESDLLNELRSWLKAIKKPAAIIVWASRLGRIVSSICNDHGISIPDSVSILCIEHDDLASNLSEVPLTNLDQDGWTVGYSAADKLNQMMNGEATENRDILIRPISVVQRRSSEASAVADEDVRDAFLFIQREFAQGLSVDDVVKEIAISRRTLEKKFNDILGMTPGQAIRNARLLEVKRLLRETNLTIRQIAEKSGFNSAEVLIRTLKKETGLNPSDFRVANS